MKKLFVIVLAAIGMVSCMNTDEVIEVNNDNAIAFADAFIENSVRAEIETADLTQFNVWGWMQEDAVTATVFEGKEVKNEGAGWTYSPAQYWVPGFTYNFQALSSNLAEADRKWEATAAEGKVSVVTFENANGTEDLIYATATVDAPALGQTKTVELKFDHQLAKVMFTINTLAVQNAIAPGFTVKAEAIKMEVPKTGELTLESGAWTVGTEKTTLEMEVGDELLTIPANYTYGIKFNVNLYKGDEFVSTLKEMTSSIKYNIEKGKAYNFVADVTPEKMEMTTIDFDTIVNDWVDNNLGLDVDDTNTIHIKSAAALKAFAEKVNAGESFNGKTVVLDTDIDLSSLTRATAYAEWTPIGGPGVFFEGTFDGKGHKVSNFQVNRESHAGLFGNARATIKNLTVENVKLVANHYAGGIVGQGYARLENCHAVNVDITVSVKQLDGTTYDYGDKAGAIIGQNCEGGLYVKNSTAKNVTIQGYRDLGGIAGMAHNNNTVSGCKVENITIIQDFTNGYPATTTTIGGIVGRQGSNVTLADNTEENVNVEAAVSTLAELQAALDNAKVGQNFIRFINDIEGVAVVIQKANTKIEINGADKKMTGAIKVHSNSQYYADAALTIKNLNFETATASVNFIEALENGSERYSSNITVDGCTFTATGDAVNTAVGVQIKSSKNAKVIGCTATNMHSLVQAQSCDESVLVQNCTVNGKNGVAFKQVKNAVVEGTTITAVEYGIRFDGNVDNYGITVKDNNVTASQPFIVRKMTGANNTIALEGTNTLTTDDIYQIVITNGSDDAAYVAPTGTYTLTGADDYVVYPTLTFDNYDEFLASISDDTWYDDTKTELAIEDVADFAAFVETANSGNDFEGKTLKLTGDIDLYFKDVTANADSDPVTFRPIGDTKYNGGKPFKGTFDGQGHIIKNLYQNGWDLGYQWGVYGSYGLFGSLEDATVKNVVIEGSESYIEGGDVSFIAGSATGDCVFENITINSGVAATYNNGCGGIIGWSGAGNYTFKNITIGENAVLGGLWGSFDSSIGGIVGQAEPGATYNFENVTINCRIDAYNDCTASYDYYNYRMCGMIIGRCEETTTIDGANYPDLSKYNMTFTNVVVNYGDWMNYHYCDPTPGLNGGRGMRVEPGYAYDGLPAGYDHSQCVDSHMNWLPFNQLIGGDQYAVKGLPAVEGVTVNYPESFYLEQGYKAEGNTYKIYSGQGFKTVATTVLNDGTKNVTIELANDIDLAGIEWPAVKTAAAFVLDGKDHTIKNLTTSAVEDHGFYSTAMFTSTRKATTIKNLVVENATVTGNGQGNSHGAVLVACNYADLQIEGVTVKNSTISNCDRTGGLVTYLYFTTATVKDCVVEGCTINSIGTAGAILGMNNGHDFEMKGCQVVNTTVSSSEGNNKAGIFIGTWQDAGTLTEDGNTHSGSKAINAGTETNNVIGRHA
ncbi:MAG: hypothetical protein J6K78_07595 [Tidjanibacter sp.]|nr:hypothetical protein [Tidjanibacter sp.]